VTVNLAPVADTVPTSVGRNNPPIGAVGRHFGAEPSSVTSKIRVVVAATQQETVLATLKHFPGLGRVTANTDFSSRAVDSRMTATDRHLAPFRAGIDEGAELVMVSSASYPRIDPHRIGTFSRRIITEVLRDDLGFTGVIVSDDVGAAVALRSVPVGDRAVRFVDAGGDLVLTVDPRHARPMSAALAARARTDPGFRASVHDSAVRVVTSKIRAGLIPCRP
jgi:beta-N-acetylhexosaminidase